MSQLVRACGTPLSSVHMCLIGEGDMQVVLFRFIEPRPKRPDAYDEVASAVWSMHAGQPPLVCDSLVRANPRGYQLCGKYALNNIVRERTDMEGACPTD